MKRLAVLVALLELTGCGSGGGNSLPSIPGHWSGTFIQSGVPAGSANQGTVSLDFASNGQITGTMTSTTGGVSGTITGNVQLGVNTGPVQGTNNMTFKPSSGATWTASDNIYVSPQDGWTMSVNPHWVNGLSQAQEADSLTLHKQ